MLLTEHPGTDPAGTHPAETHPAVEELQAIETYQDLPP